MCVGHFVCGFPVFQIICLKPKEISIAVYMFYILLVNISALGPYCRFESVLDSYISAPKSFEVIMHKRASNTLPVL